LFLFSWFSFIIYLISAFCGSSTSTDIECDYGFSVKYSVVGSIYQCTVDKNLNILTEDSAVISGVNGSHWSKSYDDVEGFYAVGQTIHFFPKDLDKLFKNLKLIEFLSCQLKEIHQSDLKVFPNLVYLYLYGNAIEVIEEGLFDFNPNLELVGFEESEIVHIDPNVFDHLTKLRYFLFFAVRCVNQEVEDSREKVQKVLKVVKSKCPNSEFLSFDDQIKNIENESKALSSEAFSTKLESFEKSFKSSELSKTRTLNEKLQNLKSAVNPIKVDQIQNNILENDLKNITDMFEDLKDSQCGLARPVDDLKVLQNELQTTLSEIKSLVTDHGSKLEVQDTMIDDIKNSLSEHGSKLETVSTTLDSLKASHDQMSKTLTDMDTKIDEKLEMLEENLINSESRNEEKIDEVKKELDELSMSIDSKLKAVENRLMERIERILKALYIF